MKDIYQLHLSYINYSKNIAFLFSFQAGKANKNVERKLFSPIVNKGCYLPDHNQHQNFSCYIYYINFFKPLEDIEFQFLQ